MNALNVLIVCKWSSLTHITWDQALLLLLLLFASFLLWREREKNNAWYIHLTSHQPPPNLHNLTSAWPVMLLANQRLPDGNQILVGIMSLSPKSILGKRKFLSTCRWRFLKKTFKCFFFYLYLTATNNKEFTSSFDFVLWRKQWKKIRLEHHISQTETCFESKDRSD